MYFYVCVHFWVNTAGLLTILKWTVDHVIWRHDVQLTLPEKSIQDGYPLERRGIKNETTCK